MNGWHSYIELACCPSVAHAVDSVSFLAVDTTSEAFNRELVWPVARQSEVALTAEDADAFEDCLERLIVNRAEDFASGFIVESPEKLRKIARRFRVQLGGAAAISPVCNAPWVSAVLEIGGAVRPCFFHPPIGDLRVDDLESVLTGERARRFRESLDVASNEVCKRCVCSLHYRA